MRESNKNRESLVDPKEPRLLPLCIASASAHPQVWNGNHSAAGDTIMSFPWSFVFLKINT